MVASFLRIAAFVAAIAALTLAAIWLGDRGGVLRLQFAGYEYSLGSVAMVVAALILVVLVWLGLRLVSLGIAVFRFLNGDETAISRYFDRNREQKGYVALAEGMMAVASGEGRLALAKAARAEKFLSRPELTNLLSAQAAEMTGDTRRAEEVYRKLLADSRTRFVGIHGLMRQRLAKGDTETALKLAEKAYALNPRHQEVQDTLLKLQAEKGDWKGARTTLEAKARQGLLPRDVAKRRDAVLALSEAKDIIAEGSSIEAREAAIAANRASPDLIPAAVMAARAYVADGKPKYAARVLQKAWEAKPHPDLATAFAEIVPDESGEDRMRRFEPLLRIHPEDDETRQLRAELSIAVEDFPAARRALGDLAETHPTARTLTLMAAISRGEGEDDAVVRGWLTRALTASRGPQWCCDNCQNIQSDWTAICDNCGSFDTLSWREPTQGGVPMAHGADMLPLIVGAPKTSPVPEPEEVRPPPRPDA